MIYAVAILSFAAGMAFDWALAVNRFTKRQAARDEYLFANAPTVQHTTEDAARRAGC